MPMEMERNISFLGIYDFLLAHIYLSRIIIKKRGRDGVMMDRGGLYCRITGATLQVGVNEQ